MSKKAFIASLITLLILAFLLAETRIAETANAQSALKPYPPSITIFGPQNDTFYNSNNVTISFYVGDAAIPAGSCGIDYIEYTLDGNTTKLYDWNYNKLYVNKDSTPIYDFNFSQPFSLSEGIHTLVVHTQGVFFPLVGNTFNLDSLSTLTFMVDTTPPSIRIIQPENTTYNGDTGVPLIVNVKEPTTWMGYSLDSQANITFFENLTLSGPATGLNDGYHNLTVYANDTAGNMGKSDVVYFTTATSHTTTAPTLSQTLAPTESPTKQPTQEPSPKPNNTQKNSTPQLIIVGVAVVTVVVALGALFYFKKRKGKP